MRQFSRSSVAVLLGLALPACTPGFAKQNSSSMFMEVARITGIGHSIGEGDTLFSDVGDGFNDDARLTVNIFVKNPNITSSSANQHVDLTSYSVRFVRTDGRNTEGVDVPYSFSGPLAFRLHTPSSGTEVEGQVVITLVRHQAKFEPPLITMIGGFTVPAPTGNLPSSFSGAGVLTTIAEITVYGTALSGQALTASGRLQVTFADFVNQ